jgi:FKBP-type peptidyl-prolyl cis-trans isomerase
MQLSTESYLIGKRKMKKIYMLILFFTGSLLTTGCGEPPQIMPVVPSGMEVVDQPPPQKEGEAPVALGETASAQVKALQKQTADAAAKAAKPFDIEDFKKQGLKVEVLAEGKGDGAKSGQSITVHYTGTLENGNKFDSSRDKNQPFTLVLGAGQVIKGWDAGLQGMKVGERRKLTIPAALGYGSSGQGSIPANSTLIFDVEMLEIK